MATITTNTFLDGGTARTAGEIWTINGGVLTIRTDTRVHAGAPASMTGTLGAVTISPTLGGGVLLDGRNVREVWFDGGSGTVPVIGTTITQGGASGYMLGVWASITSAPTTAGSAMPTSGFIKFREVTGSFTAGALTGITANALGADTLSWIEVVQRQAATNTVPRLGDFISRGGWYYLPQTTSGVAGQIIQLPTNGGGAGTHVPAIQIETGVGTNEYEWFTSAKSDFWNNTNIDTDARAKIVGTLGNGQVVIGKDGVNNVGYVPPAGCKIRIGNVILRQSVSTNDALNAEVAAVVGTRPDFTTTSGGYIDFEYLTSDWYHGYSSAYYVRMVNCSTFDAIGLNNIASPFLVDNCATGAYILSTLTAFQSIYCTYGGEVKNSRFFRGGAFSSGFVCYVGFSNNVLVENCHVGVLAYGRIASGYGYEITSSNGVNVNDCYTYNAGIRISASKNVAINNIDYTDRLKGNTNTTNPLTLFTIASGSDGVDINGITFGMKGILTGFFNPYTAFASVIGCYNIKIRNAGTRNAPLACENSTNAPLIASDGGANINVKFQRIYLTHSRTNTIATTNTSKGITFEHVYGGTGTIISSAIDCLIKGINGGAQVTTGSSSVYGSHTSDNFSSNTTGELMFYMNEPTAFNQANVTLTTTTGGFTSSGQVSLPTAGDNLIMDFPYYILGHTGFDSTRGVILYGTGLDKMEYDYDIDTGSGYTGTYKNLVKAKTRSGGGVAGTNTITFASTSTKMMEIGDYVYTQSGTQFSPGTTITNIVGDTITLSNNILVNTGGIVIFSCSPSLFSETISPTGFKFKMRVTTKDTVNTNALINMRINTTSTLSAQTDNLYILDEIIPVEATATVLADSRVQLYNVTTDTILDNVFLTGTDYAYTLTATTGDIIRLRVAKKGYLPFEAFAIYSGGSIGFLVNQTLDPVYTLYGIDGETVTKFTADFVDREVDLIVGDNFTAKEAYNWYNYILTTELGINLFFGGVTAIDAGNIRINTAIVDLLFDNTTTTNVFQYDNIRIFREDEGYPVKNPTTGGGGIDLVWRNQVYIAETGTSGLTSEEAATLAKLNALTEDVSGLRFTAKALEESPAGGGSGLTLAEIEASTILAKEATVNAIPTNPLLTTDTRLNNLDTTISSRLSSEGYTAPDNIGISNTVKTGDIILNSGSISIPL